MLPHQPWSDPATLEAPALTSVKSDTSRAVAQRPQYPWPTNASRSLSSSFCETRRGHFHFGLDVRTNRKVGYPCYAVADAEVVRIRVSPYGYGRALYLRLTDGYVAVYGHLQKFAPQIEAVVHQEQLRRRTFSCELFPAAGQLSFKKGEVVAYTGDSGVGLPHLHFEIRDSLSFHNPFRFGLTVADHQAPVPQRFAVIPLSINAELEESVEAKIYALSQRSESASFTLPVVPQVYGLVGLGVSGYDKVDDSSHSMGFYGLELFLDDSLCFRMRYDSFGLEEMKQIELERDYRLWRRDNKVIQRLFRDSACTADFYSSGDGVIDTRRYSAGRHRVRVVLSDFAGNQAEIRGGLEFVSQPRYPQVFVKPYDVRLGGLIPLQAAPTGARSAAAVGMQADFYDDYAVLRINNRGALASLSLDLWQPYFANLPLIPQGEHWIAKLPLEPFPTGPWTVVLESQEGGKSRSDTVSWTIQPISVAGGSAVSEDGLFRADFDSGAVYRTLYARISSAAGTDGSFVSRIYRVDPSDVSIRGNIRVSLPIPAEVNDASKLALYYTSWGSWRYLARDDSTLTGRLCGATARLERYALRCDATPPTAQWLLPPAISHSQRPIIKLKVSDNLSGLDDLAIVCEVDGEFVIMEYDPEARTIFGQPEGALAAGEHRVELRIADRCGNETRLSKSFRVKR